MKSKKYTITITDGEGLELVFKNVDEKDFKLQVENDLEEIPASDVELTFGGSICRGSTFNISGYVSNKEEGKNE